MARCADNGSCPAALRALAMIPKPLFRVGRSAASVPCGESLNVTGIRFLFGSVMDGGVGDADRARIVAGFLQHAVSNRGPLLFACGATRVVRFRGRLFGSPWHSSKVWASGARRGAVRWHPVAPKMHCAQRREYGSGRNHLILTLSQLGTQSMSSLPAPVGNADSTGPNSVLNPGNHFGLGFSI